MSYENLHTTSGVFLFFRQLRRPLILLIIAYAVCTLGFVLIPGIDDKGQLHHMGFMEAFYVVSYTGSTIGFGELPHPFTGAQRLWMVFTIYCTVIIWIYSIGSIVATLQNTGFQWIVRERRFIKYVRNADVPFLLVCGYGDTGALLVRELVRTYQMAVIVIDISDDRINALGFEDLGLFVPAFPYDASHPNALLRAGLNHPACIGVVAVTGSNDVNLSIAMTARLLNPSLPATCLAYDADTAANMASFNTQNIINPFTVFAQRLALTFRAPSAHVIHECLTSSYRTPTTPLLCPPHGHWIVCGYGRFGKAVYDKLIEAGNSVTVIDIDTERVIAPQGSIKGRGTESPALIEAGLMHAVGIIGCTDNEINNLSTIVTARELCPSIFTIARQNSRHSKILFEKADLGMWAQTSYLTATDAVAVLRNPLLTDFLDVLKASDEAWAAALRDRLVDTVGNVSPEVCVVHCTASLGPAIWHAFEQNASVNVGHLLCDPKDRNVQVSAIPLMLKHDDNSTVILPENNQVLCKNDELLLCGLPNDLSRMSWVINNAEVLRYIQTGLEQPSGSLWQWLSRSSIN